MFRAHPILGLLPLLLLAPACKQAVTGDTDADTDADVPVHVDLSGAVAKGPFIRGSSVSVSPVDAAGTPTGQVFQTQTSDDAGRFDLAIDVDGPVRLEAQGFYYNEVTGELSTAQITLRSYDSFVEAGHAVAFINLYTHLTSERVAAELASGIAIADAVPAAESEALLQLQVGPPSFTPGAAGGSMDLLGGDDDANAYLFALSTVLAQYAANKAGEGGPVDATLTETVNGIASDLADGTLDGGPGVPTGAELYQLQATISADTVMALLGQRFTDIGSDATVPDLHRVFDLDLDGTVDNDDTDADGDGHDRLGDGGDDCDDYDAGKGRCTVSESLSEADAVFVGEAAGDYAGSSVSSAGDVNGDGLSDILVGADASAAGDGAAYLILGPVTGRTDLATADAKLVGWWSSMAGVSVAGAGDVNGDGFSDMLVGAPGPAGPDGNAPGAAYLVLGPVAGDVDLETADATLVGEMDDVYVGMSVAGAGDVDDDGFSDVLVAAPYNNQGGIYAGAVYLVRGPVTGTVDLSTATAKLVGEESGDVAGRSVAGAGDLDGDGLADILVGASNNAAGGGDAGAAYVVLGPVTGTVDLSTADAKLVGDAYNWAGMAVDGAGDVDGDGSPDLVVGAPYNVASDVQVGAAYLVLGPVTGTVSLSAAEARFVGEGDSDMAGITVAGAGDVDGDGQADLLVGASGVDAPSGGTDAGAAYLIRAPATGTFELAKVADKLVGEAYRDSACLVAGAGDVDGDGLADILVGATLSDAGGADAGAAYLVLGGSL